MLSIFKSVQVNIDNFFRLFDEKFGDVLNYFIHTTIYARPTVGYAPALTVVNDPVSGYYSLKQPLTGSIDRCQGYAQGYALTAVASTLSLAITEERVTRLLPPLTGSIDRCQGYAPASALTAVASTLSAAITEKRAIIQ